MQQFQLPKKIRMGGGIRKELKEGNCNQETNASEKLN